MMLALLPKSTNKTNPIKKRIK